MNATQELIGGLDVLNVGAGHLVFRFDRGKKDEVTKAKKVITDMLKRGYMIFVKVGGEQERVRSFDPEREEYILEEPDVIPAAKQRQKAKGGGRRVPMNMTRATGIAPSAGG